jgi:predicted dehydrogenase
MKKPVRLLVIGAGNRGNAYAHYSELHGDLARVVGVAEPQETQRALFADRYKIPAENVFADYREALAKDRFADAVVVAVQDAMHVEAAVPFIQKGYATLLEKPMATDEAGCRKIVRVVRESNILFGVCHVVRYTSYTQQLKSMIDSGLIGEVVSVEHLEPVGYWHQAHSYVRGNWRNEAQSSSMLLAKSCHDLDWLRYIVGARCERVSSFGSLRHFRRECAPKGSSERCLDCGVESNCPYSAKKIYLDRVKQGHTGWPVCILTPCPTPETIAEALRSGPYGRCVYRCDNDVVDHQVVNMEFAGGVTASFTMTAFTSMGGRRTSIFGTRGQLRGDSRTIEHYDFLSDRMETIDTAATDFSAGGGHGGGDYGLMKHFIEAVATDDPGKILSGPQETLESHLMVFAAEKARHSGTVIEVPKE